MEVQQYEHIDTGREITHIMICWGAAIGEGKALGQIANACRAYYRGDGLMGAANIARVYLCNKPALSAYVSQNLNKIK